MSKSILASLLPLLLLAGCDANAWLPSPSEPLAQPGAQPIAPSATDAPVDGTIRIASYNIQVFGTSKLGKPQVMGILANVVRRFDIVAIQEVRSADQTILPQFVDLINAEGARYDFVIGPRLVGNGIDCLLTFARGLDARTQVCDAVLPRILSCGELHFILPRASLLVRLSSVPFCRAQCRCKQG